VIAQAVHPLSGLGEIIQDGGLGDLQLQPPAADPVVVEPGHHPFHEIGMQELAGAEVERDAEIGPHHALPALEQCSDLPEAPVAEQMDQA